MQSLKSRIFYYFVKQRLAKIARKGNSIPEMRKLRDEEAPRLFSLPAGIQSTAAEIGGCSGEWLTPSVVQGPARLLYLHGGAYVLGSVKTHRSLAAHLATAAMTPVFIVDYRLAPENPFPAALDDAVAVYKAMVNLDTTSRVAIAGDSAGGGLALALALRLRNINYQAPSALALMSPWTDLTLSSETHKTHPQVDPFFPNQDFLRTSAAHYASGQSLKNELISPLFADLGNLPPTIIHVGEKEVLLDDALELARKMSDAKTPVLCKVFPGMWHVWQIFAGRFREADESVAELGRFIRSQ